jgi:hypothetical protein
VDSVENERADNSLKSPVLLTTFLYNICLWCDNSIVGVDVVSLAGLKPPHADLPLPRRLSVQLDSVDVGIASPAPAVKETRHVQHDISILSILVCNEVGEL